MIVGTMSDDAETTVSLLEVKKTCGAKLEELGGIQDLVMECSAKEDTNVMEVMQVSEWVNKWVIEWVGKWVIMQVR